MHHPIAIKPIQGIVVVHFAGQEILRCDTALGLKEYIYPEVAYMPLSALDPDLLRDSRYFTRDAQKGEARFYHIEVNGLLAENAIWTYENPEPVIAQLQGYIAFQRDRVDSIVIEPVEQAE